MITHLCKGHGRHFEILTLSVFNINNPDNFATVKSSCGACECRVSWRIAMGDIDVFATPEDIILSKGDNTLWCNRKNGELIPKPGRLCNMKVDYELEGKPLIPVIYIELMI